MRVSKVAFVVPVLFHLACPSAPAQESEPRPEIGQLDWYGLRTVDVRTATEALEFGVGDTIDVDRDAAIERLRAVPGIDDAKITLMMMPGRVIALIGIRENGSVRLRCEDAPEGDARLSQDFLDAYDGAMSASMEGMRKGSVGEDREDGHTLSRYEPARRHQLRARELCNEQIPRLREALRTASDKKHRMVAAWAIAYAEDKSSIVPDLARAMRDPDASVRNNAVRALSVMADWSRDRDDFQLEIDHSPLIEMLESLDWTDRNKGAALLSSLAQGDRELQRELQARSLDALGEMARWTSLGHAMFSIQILAIIAGKDVEEVSGAVWREQEDGARSELIEDLIRDAKNRRFSGDPAVE